MKNSHQEFKTTIKLVYDQEIILYQNNGSIDFLLEYCQSLTHHQRRKLMQAINEATSTLKGALKPPIVVKEVTEKIDWKTRALKAEARIKVLEAENKQLREENLMLKQKVVQLEERIVELEKRNKELEQRNALLEQRIVELEQMNFKLQQRLDYFLSMNT